VAVSRRRFGAGLSSSVTGDIAGSFAATDNEGYHDHCNSHKERADGCETSSSRCGSHEFNSQEKAARRTLGGASKKYA